MLDWVFIGRTDVGDQISRAQRGAGRSVTQVDADLLTGQLDVIPDGEIHLLFATGDPDPRWRWTLPLDVLVTTARIAPLLAGRDVVLVSCLTSGPAEPAPPELAAALKDWLARLVSIAAEPWPPWRVASLCREFIGLTEPLLERPDAPSFAQLVLQAQQLIAERSAGPGQVRTVTVGALLDHTEPIAVVIPPRLAQPDVVADRQQEAIHSGLVKHGNRWSQQFAEELRPVLGLQPGDELFLTRSGTDALRLAIAGITGPARPGDVAVLPSFTFRATADVLIQLGYQLHYVDVDPSSWTLDPAALAIALDHAFTGPLAEALVRHQVRLVMCVDTFGNPCAYEPLIALCAEHGIPLIADSAAAIGSVYRGAPVSRQAAAHAFSMSFAKVLTSAGAGGALVFPRGSRNHDLTAWLGSALMDELHAIAGLDQLAVLPDLVQRRGEVAAAYTDAVRRAVDQTGAPGFSTPGVSTPEVVIQDVAAGNRHSYVHWVAQVPRRAEMAAALAELGVQTKPYFQAQHRHHEWHRRPDGSSSAFDTGLPVTDRLDQEALALPTSSELSARQLRRVCDAISIAAQQVWTPTAHMGTDQPPARMGTDQP